MSPKQLILGNPIFKKEEPRGEPFLDVAEFFCDTIQGENFVGWPSAFLRLQHCSLSCRWCDTQEVWRFGNPYTFDELFALMEKPEFNLIDKFMTGQHLVLTGGSPLRQQKTLIPFIQNFIARYHFKPYIEIENECTITPMSAMISFVDCWNNSPKLGHSGNAFDLYFKPEVLKTLSQILNSWFKFVINSDEDWDEIEAGFLQTGLIHQNQIV